MRDATLRLVERDEVPPSPWLRPEEAQLETIPLAIAEAFADANIANVDPRPCHVRGDCEVFVRMTVHERLL